MSNNDDLFSDEDFEALKSEELFKERTEVSEHPLEEYFGVEKGTTELQKAELIFKELVKHGDYDDKDQEVERDIHTVYKLALEAYEDTLKNTNFEDPKYEVMSKESAVGFLNTALSAAQSKANFKSTKDKNKIAENKVKASSEGNGDTINLKQSDLLKMLRGNPPEDIDDAEFTEITEQEGYKGDK